MEKVIKALEKNGFVVKFFENKESIKEELLKEIQDGESVGMGGSVTLQELGIYDLLKERGITTYWHWRDEDKKKALQMSVNSEVYLTSTNALTEDGMLVNLDGTGNRVASMIFGHKRVYVIAGKNKICKDYNDAIYRLEHVAAPLNAKRLNLSTPCVYTGVCSDCDSKDRICKAETTIRRNPNGTKIHVYLVDEELGY